MNDLLARPRMLKQVNLSSIRRVIKNKSTATRAEIVWETQISSTTVRSLLTEMQQNGEIESVGYDESSGGRKAERYRFKMDRYYGAAFCIMEDTIHYLVVNICGEIIESGQLDVLESNFKDSIICFLDNLSAQKEIKSIGLGVPGVVSGDSYLRKNQNNELYKFDIGSDFSQRYGVPIIIENDLNAIALGFTRCYEKQFQNEDSENTNIAFVHFEKGCISAGFIIGGKVVRGFNNYAGELGMIPADCQKSLAERMAEQMDDAQYSMLVSKIICWICGILNPKYVALGGPDFRKECLGAIEDNLYASLPHNMLSEILYSPDVLHDYYEGMAFLTADRIFDDVQFLKE